MTLTGCNTCCFIILLLLQHVQCPTSCAVCVWNTHCYTLQIFITKLILIVVLGGRLLVKIKVNFCGQNRWNLVDTFDEFSWRIHENSSFGVNSLGHVWWIFVNTFLIVLKRVTPLSKNNLTQIIIICTKITSHTLTTKIL